MGSAQRQNPLRRQSSPEPLRGRWWRGLETEESQITHGFWSGATEGMVGTYSRMRRLRQEQVDVDCLWVAPD